MEKIKLTHSLSSKREWKIDTDGFLRCNTIVLKSCVLDYLPSEMGSDLPEHLSNREFVKLYVPLDELIDEKSLSSLEGKPITLSHNWQIAGEIGSVGNIAGAPICKNGYLFADILINDPQTVDRITKFEDTSKLIEQSAGYECTVDWTPGVTPNGVQFDGIQRNIDYNHVALLRDGEGRAGADVRILNESKRGKLMDFVKFKVRNSYIRICNEDAPLLEKEMDGIDKEITNAIDPKDLQDSMDRLAELNAEKDKLDGERNTLLEQIKSLQEKLAELTSDDNMSDRLDEAMDDQQDAQDIINTSDLNPDKERRLGNSLKRYIVELHRIKNKLDPLSKERLESKQYINGVFDMLHVESVSKKSVTGANIVQLKNSNSQSNQDIQDPRQAAHLRVSNSRKKVSDRVLGSKK